MIIVAGRIHVDPNERLAYLAGCRPVIEQARAAPGCLDYHLSADPIEPDRINVFERWESAEALQSFRGGGPTEDQRAAITHAAVEEYVVEA